MSGRITVKDSEMFNLYKYFIWADRMKNAFDDLFQQNIQKTFTPTQFEIEYNFYMSYWFSGLYVVIEGWQQLGLKDKSIGALLNSQNVQLLRRYRNGIFHFQKDYFDERFLVFLRDGISRIEWIRKLHQEFDRFFDDWYKVHSAVL
jgi:hypothetical protein